MLSTFVNAQLRRKTPVLPAMLNKRTMRFKGFVGDKYVSLPCTVYS